MVAGAAAELFAHFECERHGFSLRANLHVPASGVTALFGPSGSGKTTFLRMVAGLERPDRGQFYLGGEAWLDTEQRFNLAPHQRPVGYVFQDARLFPHRTVEQNLRYGLDRAAGRGRTFRSTGWWGCYGWTVCSNGIRPGCRGGRNSGSVWGAGCSVPPDCS